MRHVRAIGLAAIGAMAVSAIALTTTSGAAPTPIAGARVDNFMLPDQAGVGHELYYYNEAKAVVIVTTAVGDKVSDQAIATLSGLQAKYADKGVHFMLLNSSLADTRETIAKAAADLDLPVLDDELQLVGRSLGVTSTGEAFVVDPKTWTVAYHGPVDASLNKSLFGGNKKASVGAALDALLAGQPVAVSQAAVKGKSLAFPDRAKQADFAKISYADDVAPVLAEKCVTCHTKGGMGPFAMTSYEVVKGFSPMIREALRTKRMPPFHADAHWGEWSNDMRLTQDEIKTVVNWIEAGSPRGEGEDPLAKLNYTPPEWPMGQPDYIVKVPGFDVPASGVIDYQDWSVASKLTEGKWLKATAWRAGAVPVVHHALAGWIPEVREDGRGFSWNTSLGGYGPGGEENLTPANTGIYIPPGGSFAYQMHYTPVGKPLRDETQVGYYFHEKQPDYILRQISVTDFSLEIPAGAARHHETAYLEFPHDALIFGTQPHCHSRCYSTKLRIRYPDGTEKVLLNQPRYDFGWQREYHFKGLLDVPAGSIMIADYVFDNSSANKANPDYTKTVTFGEQTSEEMLFTFMRFRWKDETSTNRKDEWMRELQQNITFGAFDDNIDGKLSAAEFRNDPRFAPLKQYIPVVDKDKDGFLSKVEFTSALGMMQNMRRGAAAPKADAGAAAMTQQQN